MVARYVCRNCGRVSNLPDYCCGRSMLARGSFYCPDCGNSASSPGNCCGRSMRQV